MDLLISISCHRFLILGFNYCEQLCYIVSFITCENRKIVSVAQPALNIVLQRNIFIQLWQSCNGILDKISSILVVCWIIFFVVFYPGCIKQKLYFHQSKYFSSIVLQVSNFMLLSLLSSRLLYIYGAIIYFCCITTGFQGMSLAMSIFMHVRSSCSIGLQLLL